MLYPYFEKQKRLIIFLTCFCLFYFGIKGYIGITAKGGYYSAFLDEHFNFIAWYRNLLFIGTKLGLGILGYTGTVKSAFIIEINGSNQIELVYSCLGYGVLSFWTAFVISTEGKHLNKLYWIVGGFAGFTVLNISRITIILIANYRHYSSPLQIDHHTLFNICSYVLIGIFMYAYTRTVRHNS